MNARPPPGRRRRRSLPAPCVLQALSGWSGLAAEVVTFGTNATAYSQPAGTGIIQAKAEAAEAEAVVAAVGASAAATLGRAVYGSCVVMGPVRRLLFLLRLERGAF